MLSMKRLIPTSLAHWMDGVKDLSRRVVRKCRRNHSQGKHAPGTSQATKLVDVNPENPESSTLHDSQPLQGA